MSTPYLLQKALAEEVRALFSDTRFKNTKGEEVALRVYEQFLPGQLSDEDIDHFPYAIVRVQEGSISALSEPETCNVLIFFGFWNNSLDFQGYKDVLNAITRLKIHLFSKRILDSRYRITYPFDWAIDEEEKNHPYYFGGVQTTWELPQVQQEVNFLE
ncbi:hypothetical protein [Brevibacillus aydinogluensis]|uniref:Tail terminator n=1 Tax=Brevibacillus aydinogluensis TaxID=927786 RepID=A0AA48MCT4_9BACL|nr:hypothetical protein [Brevibacillus aydinogluensis]CAJ1003881.1 Tail terminator [Brevibacillus aydinogluensis]